MADKKISALTALAQGDVVVSTDVLPIVDTSATETKKIAVNALVGAAAAAGLTNVDINSGTIDGTTIATSDITVGSGKTLNVSAGTLTLADNQISGDKVEGGTINAITINTLTSTAVNATTVDATNVEVTNIKAKDGTAAGSIADSTGVVTLASSVLTTTDINGGTIDGTAIGSSSASTGAFSTLSASSNLTLSGGTANGVLYLNGSKVATSGSGLTYDGTTLLSNANIEIAKNAPSVLWNDTAGGTQVDYSASADGGAFTVTDVPNNWPLIVLNGGAATLAHQGNYKLNTLSSGVEIVGNLGIGTSSPANKLDVEGAGKFSISTGVGVITNRNVILGASDTAGQLIFQGGSTASATAGLEYARINTTADDATSGSHDGSLNFFTTTNGTSSIKAKLDASGNLGLGVTPGTWWASAKVFQIGAGAALWGQTDARYTYLTSNTRFDGSDYRYIATGAATQYIQEAGVHSWYSQASGTGGNTFTQGSAKMTLDASGNLGVNTTTFGVGASNELAINGSSSSAVGFRRGNTLSGYIISTSTAFVLDSVSNLPMLFYTNDTERARFLSSGEFVYGATSSVYSSAFSVVYSSSTNTGLLSATSGSFAINRGGNLILAGKYNTAGDYRPFAVVQSGKENSTDGNSAGFLAFQTNGNAADATERARITSGGLLGVGVTSPQSILHVNSGTSALPTSGTTPAGIGVNTGGNSTGAGIWFSTDFGADQGISGIAGTRITGYQTDLRFYTNATNSARAFTERARITSDGDWMVGTTTTSLSTKGMFVTGGSHRYLGLCNDSATSGDANVYLNRQSSDGVLIEFRQANTAEGDISVSGSTVSYNGGHLSRYSQTTDNTQIPLVKGTVMSNLDQMAVWEKDGEPLPNEQLNCMKVSDVEGDVNVAGVFVNWNYDEEYSTNDMNVAMTGDMIIRIAQGVVVQRGDLLMSAGNGTAKPQGDDIIRSKTIAKVTSNHVTCTYEDGSYCVPCVLMAC